LSALLRCARAYGVRNFFLLFLYAALKGRFSTVLRWRGANHLPYENAPSPRDGFVKIDFAQDFAWGLERRQIGLKYAILCLTFGCIFVYSSEGIKAESGIGAV